MNSYIKAMIQHKKVQFVTFETKLPAESFIKRWNEYKRSAKSDKHVTIQQTAQKGNYKYIAQHHLGGEEGQFVFSRPKRFSRVPQETIKSQRAGGYALLQAERLTGTASTEKKVFAFISDHTIDLEVYKDLAQGNDLNIYEPYYLNCKFAYILEYFVKTKQAGHLAEQLRNLNASDVAVYQECAIPDNLGVPEKEDELYEWPSF